MREDSPHSSQRKVCEWCPAPSLLQERSPTGRGASGPRGPGHSGWSPQLVAGAWVHWQPRTRTHVGALACSPPPSSLLPLPHPRGAAGQCMEGEQVSGKGGPGGRGLELTLASPSNLKSSPEDSLESGRPECSSQPCLR